MQEKGELAITVTVLVLFQYLSSSVILLLREPAPLLSILLYHYESDCNFSILLLPLSPSMPAHRLSSHPAANGTNKKNMPQPSGHSENHGSRPIAVLVPKAIFYLLKGDYIPIT